MTAARSWLTASTPTPTLDERARLVKLLASQGYQPEQVAMMCALVWRADFAGTVENGEALVEHARLYLGDPLPGRFRVHTEITVDHYVLDTERGECVKGPVRLSAALAEVARLTGETA